MINKIASLFEYISWLYAKNAEQQLQRNIFRILKCEKNKTGETILYIQVINKTTIFYCTPMEVATQDSLLEGFSKKDVQMITYLATEALLQPKDKIIAYQYDIESKRTIFKLKNKRTGKVQDSTADKISTDKTLLKNLSQEDAHRTGYLMAMEQLAAEEEAFQLIRQSEHSQ